MVVGYSAAQVRAAEAPHLAAGEPLMRRAATALAASSYGWGSDQFQCLSLIHI